MSYNPGHYQEINCRKQNKVYYAQITLEDRLNKNGLSFLKNPTWFLKFFNMLMYSDSTRGRCIVSFSQTYLTIESLSHTWLILE